ncbi:beta strand repeat-containing protein [Rhodoluna limnophila]|uniref:beta strand repeat-containing protein n=1 Tax=Rhodoluna limnophila TaxID=232537 RepID=UPI00110596B3|nr:YDG domain-containing protein [Rhodoluna limnophila]
MFRSLLRVVSPNRQQSFADVRSKKSLIAVGLFIALMAQLFAPISAANASLSTVTALCRSTNGAGTTLETNPLYNGYYQTNGIKIVPVYSKRMYVDPRNNFNATYIGYKITNTTGSAINNVVVELTGFTGGAVSPATSNDTFFRIGTLEAAGTAQNPNLAASKTAFFYVKASGASAVDQRHDVRVSTDDGVTKTEKATCYTNIQSVQRSLAASANKVTSITTSTSTPTMGSTLDVTVIGSPGKVGSGELPDQSIIAMSPASYAAWPTKALRLEKVELQIKALGPSAISACDLGTKDFSTDSGDPANVESGNGNAQIIKIYDRLVIRDAADCIPNTKQTYETKYTFRIVGAAQSNPVITPLASISSGTQIKYTGSLPATKTSVNLTATTYPVSVNKTFVSSVVNGSNVDLTYKITATGAAGNLDELRDDPQAGMSLVSATLTDATRTTATAITGTDIGTGGDPLYRFTGPFTTTTARPLELTYVMRVATPTATTTFNNYGVGVVAGVQIGANASVTGIGAAITSSGTVTTTALVTKQPQEISFTAEPTMGVNNQQTLNGFSDSGLPLTYTSLDTSICVVSELDGVWTLTAIAEGTCQVKASQAGNTDFDPATDVTVSINVLKGQVITPSNTAFSSGTATVTVYSTSTYLVSLISLDTSICTVNANPTVSTSGNKEAIYTITQVGSTNGTCVLAANQAGDSTWGPAPEKIIQIGIGLAQNLGFIEGTPGTLAANSNINYTANGAITIVSSSFVGSTQTTKTGLPVSFRSATPAVCTLNTSFDADGAIISGYNSTSKDTTRTFTMKDAGVCTVIASQDGLDDLGVQSAYAMATEISRSFNIIASGTTAQTLAFDVIAGKTYGDSSFAALVASTNTQTTVDTTLLVAISSNTPEICTVGSSSRNAPKSTATVYLLSGGTCELKGYQAGNTTYAAATTTTTFVIAKKDVSVTGLSIPSRAYDGTKTATVSGTKALSGVVPGDTAEDIAVAGTPTAADFTDENVRSESLAISGLSLSGSKASSSYNLVALSLTGQITTRAITISFNDITINSSGTTTCLANSSVTTGSLVSGDALDSITCNPADLSGATRGNGTHTVTPSVAVIKAGSTVKTSNYNISYTAGVLTVSSATVPTIEADELVVYYGELTSTALGTSALTATGNGVKAKNGNNFVAGSVTHRINGQSIASDLAVGTYTADVEFTPTDGNNFAGNSAHRSIRVLPRKLTFSGLTVASKVYDGTTSATASGTLTLVAEPGQDGLGVLAGDDVTLDGTTTVEFTTPTVGSSKPITSSGNSLAGTKRNNYQLAQPTGVTASITARDAFITVPVADKEYDGTTSATLRCDDISVTNIVSTDLGDLDAPNCGYTGVTFPSAGAGSKTLTSANYSGSAPSLVNKPTKSKASNYRVVVSNYTALITKATPTVTLASITDALVGETKTSNGASNKSHKPVLITVSGNPAGACTISGNTITAVAAGTCTVTANQDGDDNHNSGSANRSFNISAVTPTPSPSPTDNGNGNGGGNGNNSPSPSPSASASATPTASPTASPRPSNRPTALPTPGNNRPAPLLPTPGSTPAPTAQATPSASPTAQPRAAAPAAAVVNEVLKNVAQVFEKFFGTASAAPEPGNNSNNGNANANAAAQTAVVSTNADGTNNTMNAAVKSVREVAAEKITGFAPGAGLRIEVIGSRIAGQFVVDGTSAADPIAVAAAIEESTQRTATSFARIDSVKRVIPPTAEGIYSVKIDENHREIFKASGLETPVTLASLDVDKATKWVNVEAQADTYLPGSRVYLTVTTQPIVFGEAVVDKYGHADLTGALPIDLLEFGGHSIRIVGVRSLEGVSTNADGSIQLTDTAMAEIQKFDDGTQATVLISGQATDGGSHTAVREIPLDREIAWWTVWLALIVGLLALAVRFIRPPVSARRKLISWVAALAAGVPAAIFGWLQAAYELWIGVGIAVIAAAINLFFKRSKGKDQGKR